MLSSQQAIVFRHHKLDLMTLKWGFALRQAANSFLHKGVIGLVFFCIFSLILDTNEVLWGWLHSQKQLKKDNDERISSWSTYFLSSVVLLPVFIGINLIYKHPARKTLMRSVVDALLLTSFGLISEKMIRKNRKVLIDGEIKNKQALLNLN